MNNDRRKKLILLLDIISLFFTICGIILGILSILALQKFWYHKGTTNHAHNVRELFSLVFTAVTLFVDTSSASCDVTSYFLGKSIYVSIISEQASPIEKKLAHHEKFSYQYDKYSAIVSCTGLCFGVVSLVLITAVHSQYYEDISVDVTIVAIILDFCSAILIVLALDQHMKYWNVKSIAMMVRQSLGLSKPVAIRHATNK